MNVRTTAIPSAKLALNTLAIGVVGGAMAFAPLVARAATVNATIWTTVTGTPSPKMNEGVPVGSEMVTNDVIKWTFDINDVAADTSNSTNSTWSAPTAYALSNLKGTLYNSSLTVTKGSFGGSYNSSADQMLYTICATDQNCNTNYPGTSTVFFFNFSGNSPYTQLTFPNTSPANVLSTLTFGVDAKLDFTKSWSAVSSPTISNLAGQNLIDNAFLGNYVPANTSNNAGSMGAVSEGNISLNVNSVRFSVPGPLPVAGAFSAFVCSRRLRKRISIAKAVKS